jgi:hypothetical protein
MTQGPPAEYYIPLLLRENLSSRIEGISSCLIFVSTVLPSETVLKK